jgi:hypothetical protein
MIRESVSSSPDASPPAAVDNWEQRALYGVLKDAVALARLAVDDRVEDLQLGAVLEGARSIDAAAAVTALPNR